MKIHEKIKHGHETENLNLNKVVSNMSRHKRQLKLQPVVGIDTNCLGRCKDVPNIPHH